MRYNPLLRNHKVIIGCRTFHDLLMGTLPVIGSSITRVKRVVRDSIERQEKRYSVIICAQDRNELKFYEVGNSV